jgi:hypothetical protein
MNRREFITLLGGAAAWPVAARAQQADQVPVIGMLMGYAEDDPETQASLAAFRPALGELGWIEGGNIRIDYRFAPWGRDQAQLFAKELIALRPNSSGIRRLPVSRSRERREQSRSYLWVYPILLAAASLQLAVIRLASPISSRP